MSSHHEEVRRAREEARAARERAREVERQARERAREERRRARHGDWDGRRDEDEREPEGIRAEERFSLEGVRQVRINQTAGRLTVRPCREGEAPGAVTAGQKSAPQLEIRRDGDRLEVNIRLSKGWLFRRGQGARTAVRLIHGLESVKVDLGAGDLEARDLALGKLDLDVGAGEVRCYSLKCNLRVDVGAGKIQVHDHEGLAECNTGTGDLLIDVAQVVEGSYTGDVGMGRVEMRLPPGQQVYAEAHSGIGRGRVEYAGAGEGAPTHAKVNSGIGEAVIKARDPGKETVRPRQPQPARPAGKAAASRSREAEQLRVLQMLEQGKITSQEAADLIAALQGAAPPPAEIEEEEDGA
jgi:hypothetical protein